MEDDFSIFGNKPKQLIQAGHTKRLTNFLVDYLLINILFTFTKMILMLAAPEQTYIITEPVNEWQRLYDYLMLAVFYALYMGLVEAIFKGKSLGKLITGTRAVDMDGSAIGANTAFLRGLCRAVPFSTLSGLGLICYPWQDRWTSTLVIDEKLSGYL